MQTIPLDVSKPFVPLDVFSIMWMDVPTSVVLIGARSRSLVIRLIAFRAKAVVFFLDDASDKILASSTDYRLWGEYKGFLVLLLQTG